ncbi:MAG: PIN domain-containing protein [Firmicutes bacterium]|nr:PIN domain-containing protein [Bacillota bacterium]
MGTNEPIKVFLDSSVLRVFMLGNNKTAYLVWWPLINCPIQIVLSSYTLSETLASLAESDVPPKARIAVLMGVSTGLSQANWHVRLPEPDFASVKAMEKYCRDPNDWPVLADALVERCEFVVTTDNDLLDMGEEGPITCIRPEALQTLLENDPAIQDVLRGIADASEPSPTL